MSLKWKPLTKQKSILASPCTQVPKTLHGTEHAGKVSVEKQKEPHFRGLQR